MLLIILSKKIMSVIVFHYKHFLIFLIVANVFLCHCYGLPSLNGTTNTFCEKYNETMCKNNPNGEGCNTTEECRPAENEKGNLCYVLWQNNSKTFTIKLKGCWVASHDACSSGNRCAEIKREPNVQLLFCCCEGSMCNQKMTINDHLDSSID